MNPHRFVVKCLQQTALLLALHGEDQQKINAFKRAAENLKRQGEIPENLLEVPGIGNAIAKEIQHLLNNPEASRWYQLQKNIPKEILHLLFSNTIPAKRLHKLLQHTNAQTPEELLYKLQNTPIKIKGIGPKALQQTITQLQNYLENRSKWLLHHAKQFFETLKTTIASITTQIQPIGDLLKHKNIVHPLEVLVGCDEKEKLYTLLQPLFYRSTLQENIIEGETEELQKVRIVITSQEAFEKTFLAIALPKGVAYEAVQSLPPYLWDVYEKVLPRWQQLIRYEDLKGSLHVHSHYSDGWHSIETLVQFAERQRWHYLGISDHSQSAYYANGLKKETLLQQWKEIEDLQTRYAITLFKGIESDILKDGALDYDEVTLQHFDFVIASIHSGLQMDEATATRRLLNAIRSPYTKILGHPTGRLLLRRKGYPIAVDAIIETCQENQVAIEFNANPYRMDLDARYLSKVAEAGVPIVLSADAHHIEDFDYLKTAIPVLQRAGITTEQVLTTWETEQLQEFFNT